MKKLIIIIIGVLALNVATHHAAIAGTRYIDAHNHINGKYGPPKKSATDYDGAVQRALKTMDELGIQMMIVMPPPFMPNNPRKYGAREFISAIKKYPDRFAFLGGGGSLNLMIQKAVELGRTPPKMKERFRRLAFSILSLGAKGFGELSAEHLALGPKHHHQSAPPDHPLFLLLADIAASKDVPIDIHMEAVPKRMPPPSHVLSKNNPKTLDANIAAFERLLSHNRGARIIWDHVGWDNTGYRTTELIDGLMAKHPNLYMSFKISKNDSDSTNYPMDNSGKIKEEWIALIKKYPDRFVIGSDQFYLTPKMRSRIGPPSVGSTNSFFTALPPDLAQKVGYTNAIKLFKLKQ